MQPQQNARASMSVAAGASLVLSVGAIVFSGVFTASKPATIFGGMLASVIFFLNLVAISSMRSRSSPSTSGWTDVIIAELLALIVAGSIHGVCVTTGFLFSIGIVAYVQGASARIYESSTAAAPTTPATKKRR